MPRHFSENEASSILGRAAELQQRQAEGAGAFSSRITADELKAAARSAGIDEACLEQALREARASAPLKGFPPLAVTHECEAVGELDPEDFDILMQEAGASKLNRVGCSFEMSGWRGLTRVRSSITSRDGRTQVAVESDTTISAVLALLPAYFVAPIFLAMGSFWLALAGFVIGTLLGIATMPSLSRSGHRRGAELANRLAEAAAQHSQGSQPAFESDAEEVQRA